MQMTFEQAHNLAEAAFQSYTLPENVIVEDTSGFSSEESKSSAVFSRPFFFYTKENEHLLDGDDFSTSKAYFNITVDLASGAIGETYVIISDGGNLMGDFTEENRVEAYEGAGLSEFLPTKTMTP